MWGMVFKLAVDFPLGGKISKGSLTQLYGLICLWFTGELNSLKKIYHSSWYSTAGIVCR